MGPFARSLSGIAITVLIPLLTFLYQRAQQHHENSLKAMELNAATQEQLITTAIEFGKLMDELPRPCVAAGDTSCPRELLSRQERMEAMMTAMSWRIGVIPLAEDTYQAWNKLKELFWEGGGVSERIRLAYFFGDAAKEQIPLMRCPVAASSPPCLVQMGLVQQGISAFKLQSHHVFCRLVRDVRETRVRIAHQTLTHVVADELEQSYKHPASYCQQLIAGTAR